MQNKGHLNKKEQGQQPSGGIEHFCQPKGPQPVDDQAPEEMIPPTPKAPIRCSGLGWEFTEDPNHWESMYKTYLYYVDGAQKVSAKFTIERHEGKYFAKAQGCTGIGLPGWQHGVTEMQSMP